MEINHSCRYDYFREVMLILCVCMSGRGERVFACSCRGQKKLGED